MTPKSTPRASKVPSNMKTNVLILGASYGSLFSTKLLMAGHNVTLICTKSTADLINREGSVVRFPIKGREGLLDISSKGLPGKLTASSPEDIDPGKFDLIVLGMQEAQYGSQGVRELMGRVGKSRKPCLAFEGDPIFGESGFGFLKSSKTKQRQCA